MADVSWSVAENPLVFGGTVGIAADDPTLDLSLKGLVDLRVLSAFTSTIAFDGTANVDTKIAGTVAKPSLDGRIVLDDGEIAIAEPRVVLSELSGPIVLSGQVVTLDGIRGLANGGSLSVDGSLEFENRALSGGSIDIQAQGVALELPKGLRSELDALVTFRPNPKSPSLTGDIRIVQSAYTETITIAALARQAALPVGGSPAVDRAYLDRLQLNLAVTTTDDIVVDNNYGRLAAEGNVRVVGTVAQPGMDGRITLREGGQIYLAGRTFKITRGDISFTDRRHIHPEFNIAAEANIGASSNITMTLTGTLEKPTIDLASEDGSMTPSEIASGIVGSSNSTAALALISTDLLGVTGHAMGLDSFRVEQGDYLGNEFDEDPSLIANDGTDPTTRLTVGKRLSEQVEVTISQNLRENGKTTFVVSYFPKRNVELRALSRDSGTVSLGIRHQVTFGGGQAQTPSERRVKPKVSAITFGGVDPVVAADAGKEIKLDVGDDFDFLNLQKDIDRIREAFHKQGYLEARVRTRRVEAEDARSVTVEFLIDRGPRTTLQIEGVTLPSKLITELEEAWHQNVFDQFLIDDLTHRVRRHLVTSGDLGSVVVGRIDRPDAATKRLRIDVTQGAPVTGREIRFVGNTAIDNARLAAEVTAAGLDVEAWLDRTLVERALRQAYNEEGYLKAEVTGKPQTIDGTTGVLLIEIKEGPRAEITNLKWAGVGDARQTAMEKAAAIITPAPYVALSVNDATRRIEDQYQRQGFNDAEVEVETTVAADDTVELNFKIAEGTQQVLQSVELTGNDVTRGKVLTQALRFELGKPVDIDEWTLARKRLYDTNVFRVVEIQPIPVGEAVNGVQPVKAVVKVQEYPSWSLRYGFQLEGERQAALDEFTNTRNAGVVAEIRNPNLFGRALSSGVFGLYERDRQDATLFLGTSRLFGWRARTNLYGYFQRDRLREETGADVLAITDKQGISADQRWRVKKFQVIYGYRYERNHTFDPEPGNDPLPFDIVATIAKLSEAFIFDRRDDPINSRKGTFSSVSFDQSAPFLGSDVSNRKLLMQQFLFVPVGRLVLASRAQLGFAYGRDPLQFDDRFRAGGATSVRGYGEESLGPRVRGVPSGGDRLVILNQEARFKVYRWVNGVAFVDAGNIFAKGEDWSGLSLGYGIGLRLDTPVGLLRGDLGFPKTDISLSRAGARFYFGFGHIF
jgi:outer membrane protein assembly factor BamA